VGFGKEQTINDDKWSKNFDERPHRRGAPSPENAATSAGILAPFMVPHPSPHPKRHHDRFIRFSTAHGYAQQTGTHTHTHTETTEYHNNRPHLCSTPCMRGVLVRYIDAWSSGSRYDAAKRHGKRLTTTGGWGEKYTLWCRAWDVGRTRGSFHN